MQARARTPHRHTFPPFLRRQAACNDAGIDRRLAALALVVGACGGGPLLVNGMDDARARRAALVAAARWGGDEHSLDGASLTIVEGWISSCGGVESYHYGCTEDGRMTVSRQGPCIEVSALAHEVGHVLIDDPGHNDRRWRDAAFWEAMREALRAEANDDAACVRVLDVPDVFTELNAKP